MVWKTYTGLLIKVSTPPPGPKSPILSDVTNFKFSEILGLRVLTFHVFQNQPLLPTLFGHPKSPTRAKCSVANFAIFQKSRPNVANLVDGCLTLIARYLHQIFEKHLISTSFSSSDFCFTEKTQKLILELTTIRSSS